MNIPALLSGIIALGFIGTGLYLFLKVVSFFIYCIDCFFCIFSGNGIPKRK